MFVDPELAGSATITLFMNDVHYYLVNFKPSYECTMYISGCDFYPIPGFYTLPAGEGEYVISARSDFSASVGMRTQGSGLIYDHDLVSIYDPTFRIDYGWFSHFQHIKVWKPHMKSIFERVYVPKVKELKSL